MLLEVWRLAIKLYLLVLFSFIFIIVWEDKGLVYNTEAYGIDECLDEE